MNVLITGISGLLGSLVAENANRAGYKVFGISRSNSNIKFDFPVTIRVQNLNDSVLKIDLLLDIDVIIHCAAETSFGSINHLNQNLTNITAVKKLVDAAIQSKLSKFIFVSSANTLKPGSVLNPGTEEHKLETSSTQLNYINSKITAEGIVQKAVKNYGLNAVIINPTFIINPLAGDISSNKILKYALEKSILFYPKGGKNFVDARDVSKAILKSIDKGVTGENYIISNQNYTYKDFFKLVIKARNRGAVMIPIPGFLLTFSGSVMTIIERILNKPINFNLKSARLLNANHYYISNKAKDTLDFNPVHLTETIRTKLNQQ